MTLCAGVRPCLCMLSGRRGPCDSVCFRADIGKLLSKRWREFGEYAQQAKGAGLGAAPVRKVPVVVRLVFPTIDTLTAGLCFAGNDLHLQPQRKVVRACPPNGVKVGLRDY